ncbi:MAG: hypothetical protein H6650_08955 [Ardenticatenales bacterium]|nr:hypothetical protein [Ardenticatenales bacterium]
MNQKHRIHAIALIRWKRKEEIGRVMPPPGTERFAATARLAEDAQEALFSVVIYYPLTQPLKTIIKHKAKLHFFAPDMVLPRLEQGTLLYITDGPKTIAEAIIERVCGDWEH